MPIDWRPNIVKGSSPQTPLKCFYNVYRNSEEPRIADGRPKLENLNYVNLRHCKKLQKSRHWSAITDIRGKTNRSMNRIILPVYG